MLIELIRIKTINLIKIYLLFVFRLEIHFHVAKISYIVKN
jgi:hypothetical protein